MKMENIIIALPEFHRLLDQAQTPAELLRAYYHFACSQGAHSGISFYTWQKIRRHIDTEEIQLPATELNSAWTINFLNRSPVWVSVKFSDDNDRYRWTGFELCKTPIAETSMVYRFSTPDKLLLHYKLC